MADATDLKRFECAAGNRGRRTAQTRGNLSTAIPSQARKREGVETRRAAPAPRSVPRTWGPEPGQGEGIVQTTNPPSRVALRRGGESRSWYENPLGVTPWGF